MQWSNLHKTYIWRWSCIDSETIRENVNVWQQPHRRKHRFLYCCEGVFTAPLHSNWSLSIAACVFFAVGMCLPSSCLTMDVSTDFTIPAFGGHVTIHRQLHLLIKLISVFPAQNITSSVPSTGSQCQQADKLFSKFRTYVDNWYYCCR
jgi:hypothetical protein